jgi:hypothetical protein
MTMLVLYIAVLGCAFATFSGRTMFKDGAGA